MTNKNIKTWAVLKKEREMKEKLSFTAYILLTIALLVILIISSEQFASLILSEL